MENEQIYLTKDFVIEITTKPDGVMMKKPGFVFMTGEEEDGNHRIISFVEFDDTESFEIARKGLKQFEDQINEVI